MGQRGIVQFPHSAAVAGVAMILLLCATGAGDELRLRASGVGHAPATYAGTARGRLMAERAAKIVAARNLVAPPTGAFEAHLSGVRVVRTGTLPDGGVEATVEMALPVWHVSERYLVWYPE